MGAGSFDRDTTTAVDEALRKRCDVRLKHGFASGEQHERLAQAVDLGDDFVEGHVAAAVEGVGGIAVAATQIAARRADQGTGKAGVLGFAVNARVDFGNAHGRKLATMIRAGPCVHGISKQCWNVANPIFKLYFNVQISTFTSSITRPAASPD